MTELLGIVSYADEEQDDQLPGSRYLSNCREIAKFLLIDSQLDSGQSLVSYNSRSGRYGVCFNFHQGPRSLPNSFQLVRKKEIGNQIVSEFDFTFVRSEVSPAIIYLIVDLLSTPGAIFLEKPKDGNKDFTFDKNRRPVMIINGFAEQLGPRMERFLDRFTNEAVLEIKV